MNIFDDENARYKWEQMNELHYPGAYVATMREIYNSLGPTIADLAGELAVDDLVEATRGFFGDLTDKDHFDDLSDDDVENYIHLLVTMCQVKE